MRSGFSWIGLGLALAGLWGLPQAVQAQSTCTLRPPFESLEIPATGWVSLGPEDERSPCSPRPRGPWTRGETKVDPLFVQADGPSGSGRYWNIYLGLGSTKSHAPSRGLCLRASTLGWRTLQHFETPLLWIQDLDHDGHAEFIYWGNFSIDLGHSEPPKDAPSVPGLVAWVYRQSSAGHFQLDLPLTRTLATRLRFSYRSPRPGANKELRKARQAAADQLEAFEEGRCERQPTIKRP